MKGEEDMADQLVFGGVGAYVGEVLGKTHVKFWAVDPATICFDPKKLIEVDTAISPKHVGLDKAKVDDFGDVSLEPFLRRTTIGEEFPGGQTRGALYMEEGFMTSSGLSLPPPEHAASAFAHEYKTVAYFTGTPNVRQGKRYYGFHAQIVNVLSPTKALVVIFKAGTGKNAQPTVAHAGNFEFNTQFDANVTAGGSTEIGPGPAEPRVGALFILEGLCVSLNLARPKLPAGLGG